MLRTELRVGNLVSSHVSERQKEYISDEYLYVITEIKSMKVNANIIEDYAMNIYKSTHLPYDKINPVPLAEKWLLKFGFEKKGLFINKIALMGKPSGDMDGSTLFQIGEYGQEVYFLNGKYHFQVDAHNDDYGTSITTKEIKFVHHLQNTFYILKDKELELT